MKYACLVYLKEAEITALSQGEWDALNHECMAFGAVPVASVERLGSEALEPTHTATTVRVRNGTITTTDGPSPRPRSSWRASTPSKRKTSTRRSPSRRKFRRRATAASRFGLCARSSPRTTADEK